MSFHGDIVYTTDARHYRLECVRVLIIYRAVVILIDLELLFTWIWSPAHPSQGVWQVTLHTISDSRTSNGCVIPLFLEPCWRESNEQRTWSPIALAIYRWDMFQKPGVLEQERTSDVSYKPFSYRDADMFTLVKAILSKSYSSRIVAEGCSKKHKRKNWFLHWLQFQGRSLKMVIYSGWIFYS